jgi:hypothetical protein
MWPFDRDVTGNHLLAEIGAVDQVAREGSHVAIDYRPTTRPL